jgi:hypothetical protein
MRPVVTTGCGRFRRARDVNLDAIGGLVATDARGVSRAGYAFTMGRLDQVKVGRGSERLRLSAESDQGKAEPGEHGDTQDATEGIHPTQHLVARPQREGRRSEDDQDVACPALGVA